MILNSTDPFWGNLITKLYREGFSIQQMQEAFSVPKQSFKWYGQLTIWFQESKPTCIEQIEFQNGKGPGMLHSTLPRNSDWNRSFLCI